MTPEEEILAQEQAAQQALLQNTVWGNQAQQQQALPLEEAQGEALPPEAAQEMGMEQQPPVDPNAELMAQLAQIQAELEATKAKLPDETSQRILQIAQGGKEEWEKYMELKNADYSQFSPLERLEMKFLEERSNSGKNHDELMEIFHQRMRHEFNSYDPDEDNRGLDIGAMDILGERADAWSTQKEKERQEKLLEFGAKPNKEEGVEWTPEDHDNYTKKVADHVHNTKSISIQDADGNSYEIPVSEQLAEAFVDSGPSKWIESKMLALDDKKRAYTNPESTFRLAAIEEGLPMLLSQVAKDAREKAIAELKGEKENELKSIVDKTMGINAPPAEAPRFKDANEKLMFEIQQQRFHKK